MCHALREQDYGDGPNLGHIGFTASSRRPGLCAIEYIRQSILAPSAFIAPGSSGVMPTGVAQGLDANQLRNLIAYLAQQGADPDLRAVGSLPIRPLPRPVPGSRRVERAQVEHGLRVFKEKAACAGCHTLDAQDHFARLKAPALSHAGLFDDTYLNESVTEPSRKLVARFAVTAVSLRDGRILNGRILRRSDSELSLLTLDTSGRHSVLTVPLAEIDQEPSGPAIRTPAVSPMPADLRDQLTGDDLAAVVAVLKSLH